MIFTDLAYFIFLLATALLYRQASQKIKPWVIIASGLSFYAYYATGFVWLFVIEALVVYFLTHYGKKLGYYAALAVPLLVLGYYKYSAFLFEAILPSSDNPFLYIAFPLAISFFTFEFLHYSFDFKRGKIEKDSAKNFMAFAFFYPSMAAGPIKRFQEFNSQLIEGLKSNWSDWFAGGFRILVGLFKKLVLADSLGYFSSVLNSSFYVSHASPYQVWFALIAFTFKIYFDFSGYSDIAIGSARLFGIKIPENFDYPFLSRNIAQFWRKWHMSLYSWLNDYIFTPLSVNLRNYKAWGMVFSIIAVFTVSGLWHGSDWNFVAWGAYHGLAVAFYYVYSFSLKKKLSKKEWYQSKLFTAAAIIFNFLLVAVSFALFLAPLNEAIQIISKLFFIG
ncbi:MBOAT family protein [Candidatus Micrarchaeota archaeon]|nr:MBOAT family protein [Candidatus Micrarchaeota archaeon]